MKRRVRLEDGTECDVLEVGIGQLSAGSCAAPEFFALVELDNGRMCTRSLTGAVEIPPRPVPYERPAPTSMPGPGEHG